MHPFFHFSEKYSLPPGGERGHVPAGQLRGVGIVAPYVGMQINPRDYVFRFAIPVEA